MGRGAEEVNRDEGSRGRKRSRGEVARRTGEMGSREGTAASEKERSREMGIGMRARATLSWRRYEARRRRRGSGLGGSRVRVAGATRPSRP